MAAAHQTSVARVALAWLLARPFVTSVIIGARRAEQLADNLGAVELRLAPEDLQRLDEASALPAEYPGWAVHFQNARDPRGTTGGPSAEKVRAVAAGLLK